MNVILARTADEYKNSSIYEWSRDLLSVAMVITVFEGTVLTEMQLVKSTIPSDQLYKVFIKKRKILVKPRKKHRKLVINSPSVQHVCPNTARVYVAAGGELT